MSGQTQRDMLIELVTTVKEMKDDITEIKGYTSKINGELRQNQQDVIEIKTNYTNVQKDIDDIKRRMNIFSMLAALGGGILGYLGSYFK